MPLPLPNLDDRSYAELLEEARALIPSLAPEWTNHNPSDPGITLVELFAWMAEMLVWRTNQVPDANVRAFLQLLNGPEWTPSGDLGADVRGTVLRLREDERAVTPHDYERLSTGVFNRWLDERGDTDTMRIARARCVARRYLGAGTEAERAQDAPGRVSVLVIPRRDGPPPSPLDGGGPPAADPATRTTLWRYLEERRLIGTRVDVIAPVYVPVRVEVVLARRADAPDPLPPAALAGDGWSRAPHTDVRRAVLAAIAAWLDPLSGGPGRCGWPFGRDVHVSDLYGVIEAVGGVDYVSDVRLQSPCPAGDTACVPAPEAWHGSEQVGLVLAAHHLPRAALRAADVHVAAEVVPVEVAVSLRPAPGVTPEALDLAVREAVRRRFHPGAAGPDGTRVARVRSADVRAALRALPEVDSREAVQVKLAAAGRVVEPEDRNLQGVELAPGEMAEPRLRLITDGSPLWP
ncbi:MAG: hypothetical protein ICV87_01675 [Gemmatimonadetes bacterium]|nr:hypothetical protein [Gemmatimonadota bacterium]